MARASTPTMLSLDRFFAILGIHPLHANGIYVDGLADVVGCDQPIMQYRWQAANAIGRDAIAEAIAQAEDRLSDYLGFYPMPRFVVDERQVAPRLGTPIRARHGHSISAAVEGKTLIAASAGVSFSDTDSDGYYETAEIVTATDVLDPAEIKVYYPSHGGDAAWEIRPLQSVVINAGLVTIKVRREQLVKEELQESLSATRGVDGLNDNNFNDTVDVYRSFVDPSQQVQFLWRGLGPTTFGGGCNCSATSAGACSLCILTGQYGCATVRDNRQSSYDLAPGLWDAANETYVAAPLAVRRPPERIRLWYFAGWRNLNLPRPNVQMDPMWERVIAQYAVSFLDRPLCACEETTNILQYWSDDLAMRTSSPEGSRSFALTKGSMDNPLGSTRGAINAWNLAQKHRIGEGVCAL